MCINCKAPEMKTKKRKNNATEIALKKKTNQKLNIMMMKLLRQWKKLSRENERV